MQNHYQGATVRAEKPHYAVLDALRGIAAIIVVIFHIFEPHSSGHHDQIINHGYLAVDFFFLLSGFVISYAYDDRWGQMNFTEFFKRRVLRLQPLVVLGMLIGAVMFYFQACPWMPAVADTPVWKVITAFLLGCFLIPLAPGAEIRGWGEMHPLNGPGWSLFYEYIANILYALIGRRLSNKWLAFFAAIFGTALVYLAVFGKAGDVVGGWELSLSGIRIGLTRVMFPFFAGILLHRAARLKFLKNAFFYSVVLLTIALCMPRLGGTDRLWINGIYESFCIIVVFPFIVLLGAGGTVSGARLKISKFLGDVSYPLYITHYPFIYTYTTYVARNNKPAFAEAWPYMLLTFFVSIAVAVVSLYFYDIPVRKWLNKRF